MLIGDKVKKFYITTAIDYPSAKPHMGHAYEKICTDTVARFQRLRGKDVRFTTGTDEHGLKIQRCAEKAGKKPQEYVDGMNAFFKEMCKKLDISYDDFIRTTEPRHVKVAQEIFERIHKKGDIYKGEYEGLYCVECETFYTRKDLVNDLCPVHKKSPELLKEESYFFKMSKYQKALIKHIEEHPEFIQPEAKRKEILNRLIEPLKDLCVSRTSFNWGIPIPFDKNHIMFVWTDALVNYLSSVWGKDFDRYWPADVHMIGKDIVWHHTVIWGSILMAAGIKLPKTVMVHGFINVGGEKMSKSRGTVIDPVELASKYGSDVLRYFLIRDIAFPQDGDFSEELLITRNNDELANIIGNLTHRILTFTESKCGGQVPKPGKLTARDLEMLEKMKNAPDKAAALLEAYDLRGALEEVVKLAKAGNEYFQSSKPWEGNGENCLYICANLVRTLSILLSPFMPAASGKMWQFLNLKGTVHEQKWDTAGETVIEACHKINKPEIIFKKVQTAPAQQEKPAKKK